MTILILGVLVSRRATLARAKEWDSKVANNYTYTHDKEENWRSHADQFLAEPGYHMLDDCDGLTSTVLDLLYRDGWPASKLWRCTVLSPEADEDAFIDHMIGMVELNNGDKYIVGDTFNEGKPVPLRLCPHKIIEVSRLDEGIQWRSYDSDVALNPETPDIPVNPNFKYSKSSLRRLKPAHPALVRIAKLALKKSQVDFGIVESSRSKKQQRLNVDAGASSTMNSRHLMNECYWNGRKIKCCHAIDIIAYIGRRGTYVPYSLYEKIAKAFYAAAEELGYKITWGGEWESNDGCHFQLDWQQFPIKRRK